MSRIALVYSLTFFLSLGNYLFAQEKCGTVEHMEKLRQKRSLLEEREGFEEWLKEKKRLREFRVNAQEEPSAYYIPVVVHVIHKGEAEGSGSNISETQIQSQIRVLNADFKRLNADSVETPSEFSSVAGKINIEFVLARQDPNGLPSTGIVRVRGSKNQWTINDDATLKSQSYWPAEDYLNIWVTDLSTTLLGYAQFPVSDLDGLEDAEDNRLTDGVAIDYTTFGNINDGSFNLNENFNQGRTTVHEIGHFLGLRHIWGDDNGSCGGSGDYVADTPDQSNKTSGCPSHPSSTCNIHAMFQNYMDYTNDVCMNIFTQGQVSRMVAVLENSPRRASLTASHGLYDPSPVANDLGIKSIISPTSSECNGTFISSIEVVNSGTNAITSATLKVNVDASAVETKEVSLSLSPGDVASVSFSAVNLTPGSYTVGFEILKTNSTNDGKVSDNAKQISMTIPFDIVLPVKEDFSQLPSNWMVTNPDKQTSWSVRTAPDESTTNKSIYLNFYDYEDSEGALDILTAPVFDFTAVSSPWLIFDVAYATYQNQRDGLEIYVLTECQNISEGLKIYGKYGSDLATASSSNASFVPSGFGDWRREHIDLSQFVGVGKLQLAFVGVSDWGNNLYLDNVIVVDNVRENLTLVNVNKPSPASCQVEIRPRLTVRNRGTVRATSLKIKYSLNGGETKLASFANDIDISPGEQIEVDLAQLNLSMGRNSLNFELIEPNGLFDVDTMDNKIEFVTVVNEAQNYLPLREDFDSDFDDQWTIANPLGGMEWEITSTNYNQSLLFNIYSNDLNSDETWLVSPVLDLYDAPEASVFFDLSYRGRDLSDESDRIASDSFSVWLSRDCGVSFSEVLWEAGGSSLSSINTASEWRPTSEADWTRNFIDLSSYTGNENIRLAFVAKSGGGNNIHLDNIEFFLSGNAAPYSTSDWYRIYGTQPGGPQEFYITFNLPDRQSVQYELVDMMGRRIVYEKLDDVLNQTYSIPTTGLSSGVYIVRLLIAEKYYAMKVYSGR